MEVRLVPEASFLLDSSVNLVFLLSFLLQPTNRPSPVSVFSRKIQLSAMGYLCVPT